ncbi:MAG TPA: glutamate racemase [Acidimicrobiia bacterium]|nr:glutamate racemase [Acidimicrobiia bacterium]
MIGVFDSGVGGLSVLAEIRRELPSADLLYFADQGRAPYGVRTLEEVAAMSGEVSQWLLDRGADVITIACNTASAAALHQLRARHPDVPFVGMEPAVKPAALNTTSGIIGVVATAATFQGELFASVVQRHASGATVLTTACPTWVELVEWGEIDGPQARGQIEQCLAALLEGGADTLVLGCTHFSFLVPLIEDVAGPDVAIVDPGPAVARQVRRVVGDTDGGARLILASSGDPDLLRERAGQLAGIEATEPVLACVWNGG